jgi:anti-sigma regulatory factor (Ser/Thr protein kinase)
MSYPAPDSLGIVNQPDEFCRVRDWLQAFVAWHRIPQRTAHRLDLALHEALANVIEHAYLDEAQHPIQLRLEWANNSVRLEIIDDGIAFDPLAAPLAPAAPTLDHASIGGRGLRLLRQIMHAGRYQRIDGKNILQLEIASDA